MIRNTLLHHNTASADGGDLYAQGSTVTVEQCTLADNSAGNGGGLRLPNGGQRIVVNTILYGNEPTQIGTSSEAIAVSYSLVEGGWTGEGNLDAAPLFTDAGSGDYSLQPGSPCLEPGDPDLDGDGLTFEDDPDDQDPDGTRLDIGWGPGASLPALPP